MTVSGMSLSALRPDPRDDRGAAMMTVLLVGAVLTALALTAATISLHNVRNAGRDRVATGAMGAAESGIAEGITYLRTSDAGALACSPACASNPWGNSAAPRSLTFSDGGKATVWIEVVQAFNPPTAKVATYKIHSVGSRGTGLEAGVRTLQQTVVGKPIEIPIGVYANNITMNGTPQTFQESVFSKNCISGREKMNFGTSVDAYFGIPAAAHSVKWISEKNSSCSSAESNNIHRSAACNPAYPYDQDAQGGPVSGPCAPPGGTSLFTQAQLDTYGRGLNDNELEQLRIRAKAQGNYWTSTSAWTPPNPSVYPHAVLFFDVSPNATLTIQSELDGYSWNGDCVSPARTVIIVVNHPSVGSGGLTLNSNANLSGALFVQRGQLQFNGTATWTGTLFANTIQQWNGSATSQLTSCFLQKLPGGLMNITPTRFHEVDR
jgi:Tfp pilus assembly protein PilX